MKSMRTYLSILLAVASVAAFSLASSAQASNLDRPVPAIEVPGGVLVHVQPDSWSDGLRAARALGVRVGTTYPMIDVFVAYGAPQVLQDLVRSPHVDYLEPNSRLEWMMDTSHVATRGKTLIDGKVSIPGAPKKVDGSGVGVAVVDTGVDGTHPDLVANMVSNVRFVCTNPGVVMGSLRECGGPKTAVELDDTDTPGAGGHGTHVAGTVAGTGEASSGLYRGAAPGASLYGVGIGTVLLVENALDGLRWVLDNHDQVSPRIRVVNNSWGGGHFKPEDPTVSAGTKLVDLLVKEGVTVVFAAGNGGGDGQAARTSGQCVNQTPGVVCVGNYDDANSGTRDGTIATSSSKGAKADPQTWPDVSAPGTNIISTCRVYLPVCAVFGGSTSAESYGSMTGTSMASPHVAGIIAQLLQVNPHLRPAQVEDILEDTAYEFKTAGSYVRDPANKGGLSSFDKGHGLVDVIAAVRKAAKLKGK